MQDRTIAFSLPDMFVIFCAVGCVCPCPGERDSAWHYAPAQPYLTRAMAELVSRSLDRPENRGTCGPHRIIRYVPMVFE